MSRVYSGDLAVHTIASVDLLAVVKNASFAGEIENVDGSPMPIAGMSAQAVGWGGRLETGVMSTLSTPTRVSHLDISAMTVDGTAYRTMLRGGSFEGSFTVQEGRAAGDKWRVPIVTKKDYSVRAEIMIPRSGTANPLRTILGDLLGATAADLAMAFSITINSVAVTLPMLLVNATVKGAVGDLTIVEIELKGRAPDSGSYPTAPTGTTSLLEKALNDAGTAVAFSFTPHNDAGEGANIAGNAVFGGFGFDFNGGDLINHRYTLLTTGAVTQTNS